MGNASMNVTAVQAEQISSSAIHTTEKNLNMTPYYQIP